MNKIIMTVILLTIFHPAFAEDFIHFKYYPDQMESFTETIKRFILDSSVVHSKSSIVVKNFEVNKDVKDWRKIPKNMVLDLYIPVSLLDKDKYDEYVKNRSKMESNTSQKQTINLYPVGGHSFTSVGGYTGALKQVSAGFGEVDYDQNSYLSIGEELSYYFPKFAIAGDLNFSFLKARSKNQTFSTNPSPEINSSLILKYSNDSFKSSFYGGLSFVRYSSFNMTNLSKLNLITFDKNHTFFAKIGLSRVFQVYQKKLKIDYSFLKSVSSEVNTTNTSASAFNDNIAYKGYEMRLECTLSLNKSLSLLIFSRYMKMSGASELSGYSFGGGIGYDLF